MQFLKNNTPHFIFILFLLRTGMVQDFLMSEMVCQVQTHPLTWMSQHLLLPSVMLLVFSSLHISSSLSPSSFFRPVSNKMEEQWCPVGSPSCVRSSPIYFLRNCFSWLHGWAGRGWEFTVWDHNQTKQARKSGRLFPLKHLSDLLVAQIYDFPSSSVKCETGTCDSCSIWNLWV